MDGVKLVADGIRLEKKIVKKANEAGKSSRKRSSTHNVTNISKDPGADIIIDATKGKGKKKKVTEETESSVDRTEDNGSEEESNDTEKESED